MAALTGFYGSVLGWKIVPRGLGHAQVATPNLRGAIVETPEASVTLGIGAEGF